MPVDVAADEDADITQNFESRIRLREGCRVDVYADTCGRATVGIGHLVVPGDHLQLGDVITPERVDQLFAVDSARALAAARSQAAEAGVTSEDFVVALACVCYQLGPAWTQEFPHTWAMITRGDYAGAAQALETSRWFQETPTRVQDFQAALRLLAASPETS